MLADVYLLEHGVLPHPTQHKNLSGVTMEVEEIEALIEELTEAVQETKEVWDELIDCLQNVPGVQCFILLSLHGLPLIYFYLANQYDEWRIRRLTALANTLRNQFLA